MRFASSLLGIGLAALLLAPVAHAAPSTQSKVRDGNRVLRQQLTIFGNGTVHYFVSADDPDGLYPCCVTLRLERKRDTGWKSVPKSSKGFRSECFQTPAESEQDSESKARWDSFLYPGKRMARMLKRGKLRAHGSTDIGGDIVLRL